MPSPAPTALAKAIEAPYVAVEIDLYNNSAHQTQTVRLCNRGPLIGVVSSVRTVYEPRLITPIMLGNRIAGEQYGRPVRGTPNGGVIQFLLDDNSSIWSYVVSASFLWNGRTFRVYEGTSATGLLSDLSLVYTGRVADLNCALQSGTGWVVTVKTTDASNDFNKPLVQDFYDDTFPEALRQKPRPRIWGGKCFSIEPVLIDEANLKYEVAYRNTTANFTASISGTTMTVTAMAPGSNPIWIGATLSATGMAADTQVNGYGTGLGGTGTYSVSVSQTLSSRSMTSILPPLDDILEVRVGGVPWNRTSGTPTQGEWKPGLDANGNLDGTFTLGSITDGAEVRCDAQGIAWSTCLTGELYQAVVEAVLGIGALPSSVNTAFAGTGKVSYYTGAEPKTGLDVLDEIAVGTGSWWGFDPSTGAITANLINAPGIPDVGEGSRYVISQIELATAQLAQLVPPAWRVSLEYARNWTPATQFFGAVAADDQSKWKATGINRQFVFDPTLKDLDPAAVDVAIRSLFIDIAGADGALVRLCTAWGNERRLFDVTAELSPSLVQLYRPAAVQALPFSTPDCRIHSAIRSYGGGTQQLQLWG